MAKLIGPWGFTGSLGGITAYTLRESDKIILRTTWGPSSHDIATKPAYDITRRNNREFGGRSTAAKWIRRSFQPLHAVINFNSSGPLTALLKPIQELDTDSEFGERHVLLSGQPLLLEGFNFNTRYLFDSVMRNPVAATVSKTAMEASMIFPELLPGINFFPPEPYSFYRLVAVLGLVPDVYYKNEMYRPDNVYTNHFPVQSRSDWYTVAKGSPSLNFELRLPTNLAREDYSLVLSAGVEMGTTPGSTGAVRYHGCGKIIMVR